MIGKIREKCKLFGNFFLFSGREKFFNYMKNKELIWTGYSGGFGGRSPPKVENLQVQKLQLPFSKKCQTIFRNKMLRVLISRHHEIL